jgi:anaerobic magnesium-protoporphyrin IX monomethyl ester cyclase
MAATVLLIGFYNEKAMGVQYLANALKKRGFIPHILFFKEFNSVRPTKASEKELLLLEELIEEIKPSYIGLSVMSSLYLETVHMVGRRIREKSGAPVIWGGVYPTLFPERALEHCSYVLRGEGENALAELIEALENGGAVSGIENLAYRDGKGGVVINDVRPLVQELDMLGYPDITDENRYFIHNDRMDRGRFALNSYTYELSASRGCPFACSYCSSINLNRLYRNKGKYVRFRSVESVIDELKDAKRNMKNLSVIHFWDEIFPDEDGWVEEFREKYPKEIGLPFNIWGHPLKIRERAIADLVEAGLHQIVVGIQSGSMRIRKEIFNRPETQEQIIEASRVLSKCRVPKVIYDFMLMHPYEGPEDLKETYKLCLALEHPFELQLHGLNFLPGTDITDMAVRDGVLNREELEKIMYSSIQRQYDMYWGPAAANRINDNSVWLSLIYLTQFAALKPLAGRLAASGEKGGSAAAISRLHLVMEKLSACFRLMHKAKLALHFK